MITIRPRGGIGNQMFQYAAGRALSLHHAVPLVLDVSALENDVKRSYALAPFAIEAHTGSFSYWSRLWRQLNGRYYREKGFAFDPAVRYLPADVMLDGYFQSERYFVDHADAIRRDFTLNGSLSEQAFKLLRDIESSEVSIAVHVRRGDYVSDQKTSAFHGNCSWGYYEKAMDLLKGKLGVTRHFFFSDEPEWLLSRNVAGVVVRGLQPHEDLFLMSRCKHQIVANSSFSWWGAWLNQNTEKIVIAPKRWFANEKMERQTGDLIPSGWIRL